MNLFLYIPAVISYRYCMKSRSMGFSLIELLMVIIVLSVLATMLFPVLARIQERGREVKCASNLRQLHTAAMSFASNNGGQFPLSASAKVWTRPHEDSQWSNTGWDIGWVDSYPVNANTRYSYWWEAGASIGVSNGTYCIRNGSLFPYLGDRGDESVYVCPTMQREARRFGSANDRSRVVRSYGMNNNLSGAYYQNIDGVSRTILFADQGFNPLGRGWYLANNGGNNDGNPNVNWTSTSYHQRFARNWDGAIDPGVEYIGELHGSRPGRNTGIGNVIFCDGHVERVLYTETDYLCAGNWEHGRRLTP